MRFLALCSLFLVLAKTALSVPTDSEAGQHPLVLTADAARMPSAEMVHQAAQKYTKTAMSRYTEEKTHDRVRLLSEVIEKMPDVAVLYSSRAMFYFQLQRHELAQEDFDKVIALTADTFPMAHLMKARIYTLDRLFPLARMYLGRYVKARGKDKDAVKLEADIIDGERFTFNWTSDFGHES